MDRAGRHLNLDLPAPGTVRNGLFQSPGWWHFGYSGPDRLRRGHGNGPMGDGGGRGWAGARATPRGQTAHPAHPSKTPSGSWDEQQEGDDVTGRSRALGWRWGRKQVLSGAWEAQVAGDGPWAAQGH